VSVVAIIQVWDRRRHSLEFRLSTSVEKVSGVVSVRLTALVLYAVLEEV